MIYNPTNQEHFVSSKYYINTRMAPIVENELCKCYSKQESNIKIKRRVWTW